jgi:hypothetical protein
LEFGDPDISAIELPEAVRAPAGAHLLLVPEPARSGGLHFTAWGAGTVGSAPVSEVGAAATGRVQHALDAASASLQAERDSTIGREDGAAAAAAAATADPWPGLSPPSPAPAAAARTVLSPPLAMQQLAGTLSASHLRRDDLAPPVHAAAGLRAVSPPRPGMAAVGTAAATPDRFALAEGAELRVASPLAVHGAERWFGAKGLAGTPVAGGSRALSPHAAEAAPGQQALRSDPTLDDLWAAKWGAELGARRPARTPPGPHAAPPLLALVHCACERAEVALIGCVPTADRAQGGGGRERWVRQASAKPSV